MRISGLFPDMAKLAEPPSREVVAEKAILAA
jgi:hypothetical protein